MQIGSWGTPEFGITEKLSSFFGQGRTAQGGSNLFGDQSQTTLVPATSGQYTPLGSAGAYGVQGGYSSNSTKNTTTGGTSGTGGTQNTLSSGGADPHINPSTGLWDDNYFASQQRASQDQNAALLSSLNTEFDRNAETLQNQLSGLGTSRQNALSSLGTQMEGVKTSVNKQKQSSTEAKDANTQTALDTAQQVQRQNRNTLRALGILNSSAAGELLSKPMNEFDKQRAVFIKQNTDRINELDDFINQKTAEHSDAVRQIESQYGQLVGQIQTDLRFNDRQRADAIKTANAALQQRIADIQAQQFQYATQAETLKKQFAMDIAKAQAYTQPGADVAGIYNTQLKALNDPSTSQTASIYDEQRKKQGLSNM